MNLIKTEADPPIEAEPHPYPALRLCEGKVYQFHQEDNFEFYREVSLPSCSLSVAWTGPKIPLAIWWQVIAFFELSYEETSGETQARFFFNAKTGEWKVWVFPQYSGTGMTTEEIADHPNRSIQDSELGSGFLSWGTIHQHCNMPAFQSGTDKNDEHSQNGLHITVGDLKEKEYSLHGRIVIRGQQHPIVWSQWFESTPDIEEALTRIAKQFKEFRCWKTLFPLPKEWETDPEKLREIFQQWTMRQALEEDIEIPDQWMKNLIPKYNGGYSGNHNVYPPSTDHLSHSHHHHSVGGRSIYPHQHGFAGHKSVSEEHEAIMEKLADDVYELAVSIKITETRMESLVKGIAERRRGGEGAVIHHHKPVDRAEDFLVQEIEKLINDTKGATGSGLEKAITEMLEWMNTTDVQQARAYGFGSDYE